MPLKKAEELGFTIIPDIIIFGSRQYRNNIDIDCPEFYKMLANSHTLPTSSHPSVGDFIDAFEEAAQSCDEILCLTVTARMSGTYATAITAKKILEEQGFEKPIYIHNTQQVSHGMGLMMIEAAHLTRRGLGAEEIVAKLDALQEDIGVYFALESLKHARKGGRVGAIKSLAADAIGVKLLLTFKNGTVSDLGITRNFKECLKDVFKRYQDEADAAYDCIVFHAENRPDAERLAEMIRQIQPNVVVDIEYVGSVIGIYTGSGCVGVAFRKRQ